MPQYDVLLHARNLWIASPEGADGIGGAYCWISVASPDPASAANEAKQKLLADPRFTDEVKNAGASEIEVVAAEARETQTPFESGIVFYVGDAEDT